MTLSNFLSKLNWRLIVIHLIACWFFIYSFMLLLVLHDFTFFISLVKPVKGLKIDGFRLTTDLIWFEFGPGIGLLTGFLISLAITIKKRWYWVNSLIVFLVATLLLRYHLFGWHYLKNIFLTPGSIFKEYTIGYFLVNGLVMLVIGLLLFLLRRVQQFISPFGISEKKGESMQQEGDPQTDAITD